MLPVYFAPLQGYTDHIYRQIHARIAGGVEAYFTPFVRWEKGVRNKDLRDIQPSRCEGVATIPQVIARNRDEFALLCDTVQEMGWTRIDLNMGCPFPMQTHAGRGSGLLPHADIVEDIIKEMEHRPEVEFSVKMRIGLNDESEGLALVPLLNQSPVASVCIHPRTGIQQYKGRPSMESFALFYQEISKPILFNGDILTVSQIDELEEAFPNLKGVMIGRGLLARPLLAREYREGSPCSDAEHRSAMVEMHRLMFQYCEQNLQGDSQILSRMRAFWQYQEPMVDRKIFKRIMKCGNLRNYLAAVEELAK